MSGGGLRLALPSALVLWVGTTLVLSRVRWFARPPLAERLRPYQPGGMAAPGRTGMLSLDSFRDVVGPLASQLGERVAGLLGASEPLAVRLARIHSPLDAGAFRVRQLGWSVAALSGGALVSLGLRPPAPLALLLLLGSPLLAFCVLEQRVAAASARWQQTVFLELPVVAEQLAMLLNAGYSIGAAMQRVAARGRGACARDLARVCGRVRQGLTDQEALHEWASVARVDALDRLVAVLALNREGGDLGRLLSEEARAIRRDVQRQLVEAVERKGQQVWIPVTVATLVPGVLLMAIPFVEALRLFSGS